MAPTDCEIAKIKYFTARVKSTPSNPAQRERQNTYLLAIETLIGLEKIESQYRSHVVTRQVAPPDRDHLPKFVRPREIWRDPQELNENVWEKSGGWEIDFGPRVDVINHEEKGSDVKIGVQMLNDAWKGDMECAVLVSNDSDLADACRLVRDRGVKVGIVTKADRPTGKLRKHADFHRHIMTGHIKGSQLPATVVRKNGQELNRPDEWK